MNQLNGIYFLRRQDIIKYEFEKEDKPRAIASIVEFHFPRYQRYKSYYYWCREIQIAL